jgi:hypothetical protein
MNEKELGDALLGWSTVPRPPSAEADELVRRVLQRDRRRVRRLTIATVLLWLLAVLLIPLYFTFFAVWILPKANWVMQEMITHKAGIDPPRLAYDAQMVLQVTARIGIAVVTGSVVTVLLAAWATVALVFAARRATLRQVNANLTEIAEQIRRLQPAALQG